MTEFADHSHRVVAHPSALARLRALLIDVSTLSPFMRWMLYATQAILVVLGILIAFRSSLAQSQHAIPSVLGLPAGVLGAALPISVFLSAALLAGIFRGPSWLRWPALVLLTLWLLYLGFVMVHPRQVVRGSYGTLVPAALQLAIVGGYCWVTVRARSLSLPALVLSCAVLLALAIGVRSLAALIGSGLGLQGSVLVMGYLAGLSAAPLMTAGADLAELGALGGQRIGEGARRWHPAVRGAATGALLIVLLAAVVVIQLRQPASRNGPEEYAWVHFLARLAILGGGTTLILAVARRRWRWRHHPHVHYLTFLLAGGLMLLSLVGAFTWAVDDPLPNHNLRGRHAFSVLLPSGWKDSVRYLPGSEFNDTVYHRFVSGRGTFAIVRYCGARRAAHGSPRRPGSEPSRLGYRLGGPLVHLSQGLDLGIPPVGQSLLGRSHRSDHYNTEHRRSFRALAPRAALPGCVGGGRHLRRGVRSLVRLGAGVTGLSRLQGRIQVGSPDSSQSPHLGLSGHRSLGAPDACGSVATLASRHHRRSVFLAPGRLDGGSSRGAAAETWATAASRR